MKRIMLLVLPLISLAFGANAQCIATNDAIQAGEELTYKLKFNWKFVWLNAGYAKMNLVASTYNGKPSFTTMLYSTTNRKIDHFFKMRDTLTSSPPASCNRGISEKERKKGSAIR